MKLIRTVSFILFCLVSSIITEAQHSTRYIKTFNWVEKHIQVNPLSEDLLKICIENETDIVPDHPEFPIFSKLYPLTSRGKLNVRVVDMVFEPFEVDHQSTSMGKISTQIIPHSILVEDKKKFYAGVSFVPFRRNGSAVERLLSCTIEIDHIPDQSLYYKAGPNNNFNSILSDGALYQLAISKRGIYKIDFNYLSSTLGINAASLDPNTIQLFGHPGGTLPESNMETRIDDLAELPIFIHGADDGQFDTGDFILFYGEGADKWHYNETSEDIRFENNPFDEKNFFILKIASQNGKRIESQTISQAPNYTSSSHDAYEHYENDLINLLGEFGQTSGSGQRWFGESFVNQKSQSFGGQFNFSDIILNEPFQFVLNFAGRSSNTTQLSINVDGTPFSTTINSVNTSDIEGRYARIVELRGSKVLTNSNPEMVLSFAEGTGSSTSGWLDFLQINYRQNNIYRGTPIYLKDLSALNSGIASFEISGTDNNTVVWNISDPLSPIEQVGSLQGQNLSFNYDANQFNEFIVFNPSDILEEPEFVEVLENQNLHGLNDLDMLIIYPKVFEEEALRLAEHRRAYSGLVVEAIEVNKVFNEFSASKKDPTAIRDFAKLLYDRNDRFKFLLLFGDGTYDYRNITPGLEDQNFVPAYETKESLEPLKAFPTDDFFALLGDNEGATLRGAIDIAVGRIPVSTIEDARAVVDKIIYYETNSNTLGDWRNRLAFVADDEDSNIHLNDADGIARRVENSFGVFNQEKIYFDAFKQESTPGGDRYPEANKKLNDEVFKGVLVLNYLGHGGPKGWSQERVLKIDDINSWENMDELNLMVTATCSFTGFDDPALITAGESAILNPNGGAVALFSTVRAVYASQNERLTRAVFDTIFTRPGNELLEIGEILRRSKNSNSADTVNINARKFLLIGDPALKLALPEYDVQTIQINGKEINPESPDTIRALQTVTINGIIADQSGMKIDNFNGTIFPTVFDKSTEIQTLSNDISSPSRKFNVQKNIIFKGAATVENGSFRFSFVVPVDINYEFGFGKISYYATDGVETDAGGYFTGFVVGGTEEGILTDNEGPEIELFLNDDRFVSGGITNNSPNLFAKLSDKNGINVTGTSIGHDLTAVLDENTQGTFILNDFYESEMDDYTRGTVTFPLGELENGKHSLRIKAFDVANNPGEAFTEFIVTDSESNALKHVMNYPNPFTSSTNFMFEHDLAGTPLDVLIHIYTISGKLIKTIRTNVLSNGFRVDDIQWNGKDDFENQIGRGIYLYKIKVMSDELNLIRESEFEKLVILR